MRRRYRGRRAGRIVQARRLRAIHRQDYNRAIIPLTDPGLAPGIEESPAVQTRGRPGRVFAKCLLNFGLRPDRPAGYVTASQWETGSSGQWRVTSHNGGAHRS